MIKQLRTKFIIITMCSVTVVLGVIIGSINLANYHRINSNADTILEVLLANGGKFPQEGDRFQDRLPGRAGRLPPETPYETRYFTVLADAQGEILEVNTRNIAAVTAAEARTYAGKVWDSRRSGGYEGVYKYAMTQTGENTLMVFLDRSRDLSSFYSFLLTSALISVIGIFSVFLLVVIFSKLAVKPVAESYEKQKRFITDASHEIKTPLTIIDANAEVLELNGGENQWTQSIKKQVKRLADLTAGLVTLSRMDEEGNSLVLTDFSLSDTLLETIEPFLPLAESRSKRFDLSIEKNLSLMGEEGAIGQLVSILADNAIRYGKENSTIAVTLKKQGKYHLLTFCNEVDQIAKGNLNVLFERFYRMDASRSAETGGYGIGLSIAKAIVTAHRGKISAESNDGKFLLITVLLPGI